MKNLIYILIFGNLIFINSCNLKKKKVETLNEKTELNTKTNEQPKDKNKSPDDNLICNFDKILADPKTPKQAIKLFNNNATYSEEPLSYFDKLKSDDKNIREFYFRVLINSYKISDGAYAEGLGNLGKEFIETNPKLFATFFDNNNCFNEADLKTWAKIVILEFQIIDDNIETGASEPLIYRYCNLLMKKTELYTDKQKETLNKFCNFLKNEWGDYLKSID